ncbi:alkylmercury lyase family protein [Streptomyces blastmyceticus]|uniref:Alkylmercury lyase n=1 Tax=Streptomyces blastmyceticus TaxID=68180 RepID=A0ABN0XU45_9ACTN
MRITVLTVPDCPNAPVIQERITAALVGRSATMDLVEVTDETEAARWGMTGSPTVLLDGVDPFAAPGAPPSVSCRLYRSRDGSVEGSPTVDDLRQAMKEAAMPTRKAPPADVLDPVGRAGRGRLAPVERGLRAAQQAILRHFATTGSAPGLAVLEPVAAPFRRAARDVLAELAAEDFLTLDETGAIRAAYPFSAVPTAHRVSVAGGADVWSMCAIDALGIPAMLGTDVVISSADPVTGTPVTVTVTGGRMEWKPQSAVVFVGRRSGPGPAAEVCCDTLNFFTDAANARAWAAQHPDVTGEVVHHAQAEQLGTRVFGPLLGETPAVRPCDC